MAIRLPGRPEWTHVKALAFGVVNDWRFGSVAYPLEYKCIAWEDKHYNALFFVNIIARLHPAIKKYICTSYTEIIISLYNKHAIVVAKGQWPLGEQAVWYSKGLPRRMTPFTCFAFLSWAGEGGVRNLQTRQF